MSLTRAKNYASRCRTDDAPSVGEGAYLAFRELIKEIQELQARVDDLESQLRRMR